MTHAIFRGQNGCRHDTLGNACYAAALTAPRIILKFEIELIGFWAIGRVVCRERDKHCISRPWPSQISGPDLQNGDSNYTRSPLFVERWIGSHKNALDRN